MSRRLLRGITQHSHSKARHRRLRSLERRADTADADRALLEQRVGGIEAAMRMMRAPLDGDVPAELASAIAYGHRDVTLEVAGETVMAGLDAEKPGDVVEILRAVRRFAGEEQAS